MNKFKSTEEEYFSYYLEDLKEAGYIEWWGYEVSTYILSEPLSLGYLQLDKKGNIKAKMEHLLREATITSDFTIKWLEKAKNVFYLDYSEEINCNVKDIPFRVDSIFDKTSQVEVKGSMEFNTTSSISFPYKQKWCYQLHKVYIQKIKPYHQKDGLLFDKTFTPKKVIELEVYARDCKFGKKGQSKLKYNVKTLKQYAEENT